MIKNAGGQLLKTRSTVLHPAMPKQDKKNAATCIFELPLRADYSRETRVKFVNPLCNGATDQDTDKSLFLGKRLSVCHT